MSKAKDQIEREKRREEDIKSLNSDDFFNVLDKLLSDTIIKEELHKIKEVYNNERRSNSD